MSPLLASKSRNVFRLFMSDTGLLTSEYPAKTKIELINKNGGVNNGAHIENAVVQQLAANGFVPYFCKKKNIGEMDFVIEMSGRNSDLSFDLYVLSFEGDRNRSNNSRFRYWGFVKHYVHEIKGAGVTWSLN